MHRALDLARIAVGRTSPNPAVGAVIVKDGRVVGEGFTRPPGGPHAEIVALRQAGEAAAGAEMYVTLEPCCHYGRTPPCTRAIIAAGIQTVVIATLDPFGSVNGRGRAELEAAGLRVVVGECQAEAERLNEVFVKYARTGQPFVTVKWAMTLDGKIATRASHSRWISGPASRQLVHELRDRSDAVIVGANTVVADDPALTVRLPEDGSRPPPHRPPLSVIVTARGALPFGRRLLSPPLSGRTLVATTELADQDWRREVAARGAEVVLLPQRDGRVDLHALLADLAERERLALMVEGGGVLAGAMLEAEVVDKVYAFIAPKIVGGREAPSPVAGTGVTTMDQATRIDAFEVRRVGDDVLLVGYPRYDKETRCSLESSKRLAGSSA